MSPREAKNKGGRPPKPINLRELAKLAQFGCTLEEAAAWFNITDRTLKSRLHDPAVREVWEKGQCDGRTSIRRAQYRAALKGDRTMLVWLGKTRLGQREEVVVEDRLTLMTEVATQYERLARAGKAAALGTARETGDAG